MKRYRDTVETLSKQDSSEVFSNGKSEHAAVIYEFFFKRAKQSVDVFCNSLKCIVYEDNKVVDALIDCLDREVNVTIITQGFPESLRIKELTKKYSNLTLLPCAEGLHPKLIDFRANFSVVDSRSVRFEPNKTEHKAWASFNNPKNGRKLKKTFKDFVHYWNQQITEATNECGA